MRLFDRILRKLGLRRVNRYGLEIDNRLLPQLKDIAAHEQRPLKEITNHLLTHAVYDYVGEEEKVLAWNSLSAREQQVTALACLGYTNQEIAQHLNISVPTVKSHMTRILLKVGVKNRAQLQDYFNWDFRGWA